jgi:hypothetical protein
MGMDYNSTIPNLSERAKELFYFFSLLNRRRIEHRPLQKNDILDELGGCQYQDKCLNIIETIDSYWLSKEADRIKNQKS